MRLKGVAKSYTQLVQDMYKDRAAYFMCTNGYGKDFGVTVGLHQGSPLRLFLCNNDKLLDREYQKNGTLQNDVAQ